MKTIQLNFNSIQIKKLQRVILVTGFLLLCSIFNLKVSGQLTLLSEGFETTVPPTGWANLRTGSGNFWSAGTYSGSGHSGIGYAEYKYNSTNAANAWLITPAVALTAGNNYAISYWVRSAGATFPEKLNVTVGNAQTIAAQSVILQTINPVINTGYTLQTINYSPVSSGNYFFGWNCFSDADQFYLNVDDISITCSSCPFINIDPSVLATFTSTAGVPSLQQAYTVSGFALSGNLTITAPSGFEISLTGGGGFVSSNPISLAPVGGLVPETMIFVRSNSASATTFSGVLGNVSTGATTRNITLNGNNTPCTVQTNTLTLTAASPGTQNWSTAGWSLGWPPRPCENAIVTYTDNTNGTDEKRVFVDIPVNVNNLTITNTPSSNGQKGLLVYGNFPFVVGGDLLVSASGGNNALTEAYFGTTSSLLVRGNSTFGNTSGSQRISSIGSYSGNPTFTFLGNILYYSRALNYSGGTWIFDGPATQTITAANPITYTNAFSFKNLKVGFMNAPTLTFAGATTTPFYLAGGDLTINPGATLQLPSAYRLNQFSGITGSIRMKNTSKMIISGTTGGETASNFPLNIANYNLDKNSTVEYNGTGNQAVHFGPVYGNLTITNNSNKYIRNNLFVDNNFTINSGATFSSYDITNSTGYITVFSGPSLLNNGSIVGNASNSRFGFYGNSAQTYSGSGTFGTIAIPFQSGGVDIANTSDVTLSSPVITSRLNLFYGQFKNSTQITIGSGTFGLIQRGGSTGFNAGSLDNYPVYNAGTNYILRYDNANAVTTGFEIPVSRAVTTVYSNNANNASLAGGDLTINTDIQLLLGSFNIAANKLNLPGTITRTSGNINGANGTLEMTGTVAQTIPASAFLNNNLKNLIISNTNNSTGVTLAGPLDIYRSLNFGASGRRLTTGGFLTMKSTVSETAWLGQMTASHTLSGTATVERNIPLHNKAWQFLSTPITAASTQTLKQAWQDTATAVNQNRFSGYGTMLTSHVVGAATQPVPGFDAQTSAGASIKVFNKSSGSFVGITSTAVPVSNPKGYMVFVRGDRSVITHNGTATATVMRTKGTLHTPASPPASITLSTPGFESIGNPYASAINFRSLTFTGGVQPDFFYMWDPKLANVGVNSAYGYGGYQTFSWNGSSFDVTPGDSSYAGSNRNIESGQAFFVNAPFSAGTVSFSESAKVSGSFNVNRMPVKKLSQLRTSLYVIHEGIRAQVDGNMVQFSRAWSDAVDMQDGLKLENSGENLSLLRHAKKLSVERRPLPGMTDTVFYDITKCRIRSYELEFELQNMEQPGLEAFLEDSFLGNATAVNMRGRTSIFFQVTNNPASYASSRFRLVFRQAKIYGNPSVAFESALKIPGKEAEVIKSTEQEDKSASMLVFPNPVIGKNLQLQFNNLLAGKYNISLVNTAGQIVLSETRQIKNPESNIQLHLSKGISPGMYRLNCISETGELKSISVMIE